MYGILLTTHVHGKRSNTSNRHRPSLLNQAAYKSCKRTQTAWGTLYRMYICQSYKGGSDPLENHCESASMLTSFASYKIRRRRVSTGKFTIQRCTSSSSSCCRRYSSAVIPAAFASLSTASFGCASEVMMTEGTKSSVASPAAQTRSKHREQV